jgi:hypothetical protein
MASIFFIWFQMFLDSQRAGFVRRAAVYIAVWTEPD